MAWSLVSQAKAFTGVGVDTCTTSSINTTGADLLIFAIGGDSGTATISDSKTNPNWTLAVANTAFFRQSIYYAYSPTVGTGHTFTGTGTGAWDGSIQVFAFSGADTTSGVQDAENSNTTFGGSTLTTGSVTPTDNGQLIFTAFNHSATPDPTINLSFSTPYGDPGGVSGYVACHCEYLVQTTAAAINPTWTPGSSGNLYATIATFKAGAGTPSPVTGDGTITIGFSSIDGAGLLPSLVTIGQRIGGIRVV